MDTLRYYYAQASSPSPLPNLVPAFFLPNQNSSFFQHLDLTPSFAPLLLVSFLQNIIAWSALYLPTILFIYIYRAQLARFKINPEETPADLKLKELRRTVTSLTILAFWDTLVLAPHVTSTPLTEVVSPIRFLVYVFLFLWSDLHFYTIHRALHHPIWYSNIHKVHHESINPNPLSGLSFHPIEGLIYFSALLIVFLVPLSPIEYTAYKFGLVWAPLGGHIGYTTYDVTKNKLEPRKFEHYVHHIKFNNNFGAGLFPDGWVWDQFLGTVWPEDKPILRQGSSSSSSSNNNKTK